MVFEEQRRAQVPPTLTLSHTHTLSDPIQSPSPFLRANLRTVQISNTSIPLTLIRFCLANCASLPLLLSLLTPPPPSSSSLPRSLSSSIDTLHVWKRQDSVWKQDQVGGQESLLWPGDPGTPVSIPQCLAAPSSSPA